MAKAKLKGEQRVVLEVMAGQSVGYLISPHASAFAAEGLTPGEVEEALNILGRRGLVSHLTTEVVEIHGETEVPVLGDDGQPLVVSEGWHITDDGHAALG